MIDTVWERIKACSGELFYHNGDSEFTYEVWGDTLKISGSNLGITRGLLEEALQYVPLDNALPLQRLQSPSYIYSILTDTRISEGLW